MSAKKEQPPAVRPPESFQDDFSDYRSPDDASFDKFIKALDRAYHRPWVMMWRSFLHGLMAGLGATIGTTLVLAALTYAFQLFNGAQVITDYLKSLSDTVVNETSDSINDRIGNPTVTIVVPSPSPTLPTGKTP